ncbi:hypothetical protein SAMN00777080_1277 [Aquiflexum balticum DSM 16537]|uniref:Uncharacterized protein n=1 Tax=Aquiflexum balticum DSM 16537 TaxID=758820 RepID=A0A1W2H189_9BACT|nr:hypothetical protein SAMN00777080_1277 [Aquiflexum balticum DSM 16537]
MRKSKSWAMSINNTTKASCMFRNLQSSFEKYIPCFGQFIGVLVLDSFGKSGFYSIFF